GVRLGDPEPQRLPGPDLRKADDHHLAVGAHGLPDVEAGLADGLALQRLDRQRLAGVEHDRPRALRRAAGAHDGQVLKGALTLGHVVGELEGVRLGRLQEVDDLAVLVRALDEASLAVALSEERRGGEQQRGDETRAHGCLRPLTTTEAGSGPAFTKLTLTR